MFQPGTPLCFSLLFAVFPLMGEIVHDGDDEKVAQKTAQPPEIIGQEYPRRGNDEVPFPPTVLERAEQRTGDEEKERYDLHQEALAHAHERPGSAAARYDHAYAEQERARRRRKADGSHIALPGNGKPVRKVAVFDGGKRNARNGERNQNSSGYAGAARQIRVAHGGCEAEPAPLEYEPERDARQPVKRQLLTNGGKPYAHGDNDEKQRERKWNLALFLFPARLRPAAACRRGSDFFSHSYTSFLTKKLTSLLG